MGALFAYRISSPVVDLDLFHQMALAREWLGTGRFPRADSFAFTPTVQPLMHHEWGAGVIAWAVAASLGGAGLLLLKYALGALFAVACVRLALRMGGEAATVLALSPFAVLLAGAGYGPVRAQAYSFLCASVTLWCCERDRAGAPRWLLLLPPLFVLWVNLHAGFVIGLAILLFHAVELRLERRRTRHVLALLGLLAAAVALNPYGLDYYRHLARALAQDRHLIAEWDPLWAATAIPNQRWAFLASALVLAYALAFGQARPRRGLVHVVALGLLGLEHVRMLPFYALAWLAYTPALLRGSLLSESARRLLERRPRAVAAASVACGVAAAALFLDARPWELRIPNEPLAPEPGSTALHYPVGAVNYLRSRDFRGAALTSFVQGSYVSWKLHPKVKVSLDSRFEAAYPYDVAERLIRLYQTGRGLEEVLADYRPDVLLVPRESALARARIPWRRVYQDGGFALYARPGLDLDPSAEPVPTVDAFP